MPMRHKYVLLLGIGLQNNFPLEYFSMVFHICSTSTCQHQKKTNNEHAYCVLHCQQNEVSNTQVINLTLVKIDINIKLNNEPSPQLVTFDLPKAKKIPLPGIEPGSPG